MPRYRDCGEKLVNNFWAKNLEKLNEELGEMRLGQQNATLNPGFGHSDIGSLN
jgi:hypothetical protein